MGEDCSMSSEPAAKETKETKEVIEGYDIPVPKSHPNYQMYVNRAKRLAGLAAKKAARGRGFKGLSSQSELKHMAEGTLDELGQSAPDASVVPPARSRQPTAGKWERDSSRQPTADKWERDRAPSSSSSRSRSRSPAHSKKKKHKRSPSRSRSRSSGDGPAASSRSRSRSGSPDHSKKGKKKHKKKHKRSNKKHKHKQKKHKEKQEARGGSSEK
eukprot:g17952.t1